MKRTSGRAKRHRGRAPGGGAALEAELVGMRVSALKRRARAAGVAAGAVDGVDDTDDPKAAIVTILLEVIPHHETFSTTTQPPYSSTKG